MRPSQVELAFCEINSIPHEVKEVRISKGQQKSAEFLLINPNGYLPAIDDAGFNLSESHAVLRYLAQTRNDSHRTGTPTTFSKEQLWISTLIGITQT